MNPMATTMHIRALGRSMPAPMRPGFAGELAGCESSEDLYSLVEQGPFVDPDALNEVMARGLYADYAEWRQRPLAAI